MITKHNLDQYLHNSFVVSKHYNPNEPVEICRSHLDNVSIEEVQKSLEAHQATFQITSKKIIIDTLTPQRWTK